MCHHYPDLRHLIIHLHRYPSPHRSYHHRLYLRQGLIRFQQDQRYHRHLNPDLNSPVYHLYRYQQDYYHQVLFLLSLEYHRYPNPDPGSLVYHLHPYPVLVLEYHHYLDPLHPPFHLYPYRFHQLLHLG